MGTKKRRKDLGVPRQPSFDMIEDLRVLKGRGLEKKSDYAKALGLTVSAFDRRIVRLRAYGLLCPGIQDGHSTFSLTFPSER